MKGRTTRTVPIEIEADQDFVFGIPIVGLESKKYDIAIPAGHGLGVVHFPSIEQNFNHSYESWFVELLNVILIRTEDYTRELITRSRVTYSMSRMLPGGMPKRGNGKWQLLDQIPRHRTLKDYPHMSYCSLNSFDPPSKRNWFLLAHCGLTEKSWSEEPRKYEEVMHLPSSEWVGEVHIQMMMHIHLIKRAKKTASTFSLEDWHSLILTVLEQMPVFRMAKSPEKAKQLINEYLNNFLHDYLVIIE